MRPRHPALHAIGMLAFSSDRYVKGDPIALGGGKVSCLTFFAKFAKGDYTTVQGISPLADRFPDVQVQKRGDDVNRAHRRRHWM